MNNYPPDKEKPTSLILLAAFYGPDAVETRLRVRIHIVKG